jgi:hypothetical protein
MKNIIISILSILFFMACGQKSSDNNKPYQEVIPVCGDKSSACLPTADWLITINKTNFPSNVLIKFNDYVLLDECSGDKSPLTINRESTILIQSSSSYFIPDNKGFKFELIDMGENCVENNLFYSNLSQTYVLSGERSQRKLEFSIK